jgi:phosphoglycolate phosphatase
MFDAILFDLDGTLLDTLEDLSDSMNSVLAARSLPLHPMDAYRHFVGDGMENLARRVLPEELRGRDDEVRSCMAAMHEEYGKRWASKTAPYSGVDALLQGISRRNLPAAVLSNKPHDFTVEVVGHFFGSNAFQAVFGARPGVARKPDPIAALEISRLLQVAPAHFLYIGDTDTDMRTAVAAGMFPVGALWGFRDGAELLTAGARVLLERPERILELIDGGFPLAGA